jgi:hypothetical protein
VVTHLEGVPPECHAAVLEILQKMLGPHEADLEVTVQRVPEGWRVRVLAAEPDDGPSLLPPASRDIIYADLADTLASVLAAGLPPGPDE